MCKLSSVQSACLIESLWVDNDEEPSIELSNRCTSGGVRERQKEGPHTFQQKVDPAGVSQDSYSAVYARVYPKVFVRGLEVISFERNFEYALY